MSTAKSLLRPGLLLAAALSLTGCFQQSIVIKVSPDGSGIIHRRGFANPAALDAVFSDPELGRVLNNNEIDALGQAMGKGLTVRESAQGTNAAGWGGQEIIWEFEDINEVSVGILDLLPAEGAPPEMANIRLRFEMADDGELQIHTPDLNPLFDEIAGDMDDLDDPTFTAMMKNALQGSRIGLFLQVEGEITETDAAHAAGPLVTLLDLDLGTLFSDLGNLRKIGTLNAPDLREDRAALQEALDGIEGVRADAQETIEVSFE